MSEARKEGAFDPEALCDRYNEEREKQLRTEGNDQYVEMTGEYARYLEDPYINEKTEREAVSNDVDVVLIGGGSIRFFELLAESREAGNFNGLEFS